MEKHGFSIFFFQNDLLIKQLLIKINVNTIFVFTRGNQKVSYTRKKKKLKKIMECREKSMKLFF